MNRDSERMKILFVTGTRADFGKLKPLIIEVSQSSDFDYTIFATGMHMISRYGYTFIEIEKSGFQNIYSYINQDGSVNSQMDIILANTIQGMAHYVREHPTDLIVVHGDRVEALAGAIVGALGNTRIAHLEGGEISGTVDELVRHAITKLSHIHFVSNHEARKRLIQMGELPDSIYVIGSPDIDVMLSPNLPGIQEVRKYYQIPFSEYGIFIYHSVTTELPMLREHIKEAIDAVCASEKNFVVIYPNNDSGAEIIFEEIEVLENNPRFRIIPSMRFEFFLALLKNAQMVVGNSSAGIREAPVFGIPAINIGSRQLNRYKYDSIVDVPNDKNKILSAMENLPRNVPSSKHFGEGTSAKQFIKTLKEPQFWGKPIQKQFRDWVGDR